MTVKILCVAGARPNFPKIAPIMRALEAVDGCEPRLVHTGQHYDDSLSKVFFDDLDIPRPDVDLEVGSGSHAIQTAQIMERFEQTLRAEQPQAVLVVGDVNSTIACALVATKFALDEPFDCASGIRNRPIVVHVEAGLRSFDHAMPEEVNRILTDRISDLLFVTEPSGIENLGKEGVSNDRVHFVGNVMIDSLLLAKDKALESTVVERLGVKEGDYALVTLHRPSNVDNRDNLQRIVSTLDQVAEKVRLVFPVHPRTQARLDEFGIELGERWVQTGPLGYLDFVKLMACARLVMSDSGGIQEETTILKVPCLTLRENTERPVTISDGTNILAGTTRRGILEAFDSAMAMKPEEREPKLWDGKSGQRIAAVLREYFRRGD